MVFVLSEKPSQAEFIARNVLSSSSRAKGGRGYVGKFNGMDILVFPLSGSIIEIDEDVFPENRRDLGSLPILPPDGDYYKRRCIGVGGGKDEEENSRAKICRSIKFVLKEYPPSKVLLATDFDYEGAALGVEALIYAGFLGPGMEEKEGISVRSVDISNLSPKILKENIKKSLEGANGYDWRTYATIGRIRQDFNAGIGIQVSRIYGTKAETKTTFGTQQTRLLKEIVTRSREHFSFGETYQYRILIRSKIGTFIYEPDAPEKKGDRDYVYAIFKKIEGERHLEIREVKVNRKLLKSQSWYDGSDVAAKAAKILKISTVDLMSKEAGLIQKMYESGYMTYPRGECDGMMPLSQLEEQQKIATMLASYIDAPRLDLSIKKEYLWFKDGEKNINHTPYTIASDADVLGDLSDEEKVIYAISAIQVLSTFYPDVKQTQYRIVGGVGPDMIPCRIRILNDDDPGWKEITGDKIEKANLPADFGKGSVLDILDIEFEKYRISPPPLFNKNSLHQIMKKKKIGTESTYRTHILNVLDPERGYVEILKGGKIKASPKGEAVVDLAPDDAIMALELFKKRIEEPLVRGKIDGFRALHERNVIIEHVYRSVLEAANSEKGAELFRKINAYTYEAEKRLKPYRGPRTISSPTGLICPECKKGEIIEREKTFSCEFNTYVKDGERFPDGWCPFVIFKEKSGTTAKGNAYKGRLDRETLRDILESGVGEIVIDYGGGKKFPRNVTVEEKIFESDTESGYVKRFFLNFIREDI